MNVVLPDGEKLRPESLEECPVRLLVLIDADAEDDYSLACVRRCELTERGRLLHAGRAPGCPEIQHQDLAAEIRQGHGPPAVRLHGELRRIVSGYHNPL